MSAVHPEPGLKVGARYTLTERIAGGGMGEVWRALDDVLGREVAVKLLRREYADDESFLERFRAEARHAASLAHAGIASVYDYGEDDGVAYLVMELVDGEPLSARIAREGALPAAVAVPLLQQAAAALQAAHDGGLVHRDVKPANLLLTHDDQVKITDFGIARAGDQAPITRTGEVMGTAQYLSPEQAMGRGATPASDVYALGVVAYEALAGRRPFDHDSMVATAMAQVNDQPDPLPPSVPAPVAAVVLRALAKDPANRPASAADLGAALGAALTAPPGFDDATQAMGATEAALLAGAPAALGSGAVPAPTAAMPAVPPAVAPATTGLTTSGAVLPPEPARGGRGGGRAVLVAVLVVLLLGAGIALAMSQLGGDDGTDGAGAGTSSTTSTSATRPTSSSATSETSTQDDTVTVDPADYVGRPEKDVRDDLRGLGLKTKSERVTDDADKGTVVSLSPTGDLHQGDTVTLKVSDGKADTPTQTETPTTTSSTTSTTSTSTSTSSTSTSTTTKGNGSGGGGGGAAATPTSPATQTGGSTGAAKATPTSPGGGGAG